jgi:UbiD family decarboxylase
VKTPFPEVNTTMPTPPSNDTSPDLREFLALAEAQGHVTRITAPVSPRFELARRLHDAPDRILWFEQVEGAAVGAVGGVAGRRALLSAALGVEPTGLVPHIAAALASSEPAQVTAPDAPFRHETVDEPDLRRELPPVVFYPQGERAYLSAGIIAARSARHGMNYSFHRMMFLGENRLVVRVVPRHLKMILDEGQGTAQVAVLLGVHPALSVAAACSGAPDLDELALAGRLAGRPLPAVDLGGLQVPAGTEIVLEGRFTGELAEEGPFVDITGTLDGVRSQPVLEIQRLYRRPGAICPVIMPGGSEHRLLMGLPQEPRIWNTVQAAVPALRDLRLTRGGCSWLHAVVALEAPVAGQGKNAGLAALAAHPSLKRVVVVDSDVDPGDPDQVEWAIATRCQPDRDVVIVGHARGSSLDPSRDVEQGTTSKWIVDATRPTGGDPADFLRVEPPELDRNTLAHDGESNPSE